MLRVLIGLVLMLTGCSEMLIHQHPDAHTVFEYKDHFEGNALERAAAAAAHKKKAAFNFGLVDHDLAPSHALSMQAPIRRDFGKSRLSANLLASVWNLS